MLNPKRASRDEAAWAAERGADDASPPVSIVISTLDRAEYLERTLTGLRQLRYPNFEIIVIQGPCTDSTPDVLRRQAGTVRVGHCPAPNLSMSRNIGIAMAKGAFVAFIDDDAVPEPDWLDQLMSNLTDPAVAGVGGFIRNPDGVSFQYRSVVGDRLGNAYHRPFVALPRAPDRFISPTGTNIAIRREALLQIGGFDEHYAYFLDETDLNIRLFDSGWRLTMAPQAEVHHKYARNQFRAADRAPRSMYLIARSKAYFCWRNAMGRLSTDHIEQHLAAFRGRRTAIVRKALRRGRIDSTTYSRLLREIENGMSDGAQSARTNAERVLVSDSLLKTYEGERFLRFRHPKRVGERMRLCMIAQTYPVYGGDDAGRYAHDIAVGLAALGHEVTVICRGTGWRTTVDFIDGVWVHAVPLRQRPAIVAAAEEIARILPRRAFQVLCRPIADADGVPALRYVSLTGTQGHGTAGLRRDPSSYLGHWRDVALRRFARISRSMKATLGPLFPGQGRGAGKNAPVMPIVPPTGDPREATWLKACENRLSLSAHH